MKLKKSSLAMILALVLTLTTVVGGTLAYLTDTDAKVNEFTMGDVDIELDEEYEQGTELLPGVEVDKTAGITNVGKNDAWVIMTVAVPAANGTPVVNPTFDDAGWSTQGTQKVTIEGEEYLLYAYTYDKALEPEAKTGNLLTDIELDKRVDYNPHTGKYALVENGVVTPIDSELDAGKVYVNAYAIQTKGFDSPKAAYDAYVNQWSTLEKGWTEDQILLPKTPDVVVSNSDDLAAAIKNSDDKLIELKAGEYTLPTISSAQAPTEKDITIMGTKETVIDMSKAVTAANCNVTFEGVTVDFADSANYIGLQHTKKVVYKDCTITGQQTLYAPEAEFINCVFENKNNAYCIWTYGGTDVTFSNCTFNTSGKAILVYTEGETHAAIKVDGCTFNDDDGANVKKAAVEVGSSPYSDATTYDITITDCTVNGFAVNDEGLNTGSKMWGNKNSMDKDHLNVVINGVDVY